METNNILQDGTQMQMVEISTLSSEVRSQPCRNMYKESTEKE